MADNYNPSSALYLSALKKLAVCTDARLDALESLGAQANVLEGIQVNGVAQTIAEKMVDILIATGTTNGTLAVAGLDVAVKGLAALAYKSEVTEDDLAEALKTTIANGTAAKTAADTLVGSDTGKSARTIANEELAKQLIPEGAKESLDTLTEIAAWIQDHPDDVAGINAAISKLNAIFAGIGGTDEPATVAAYVDSAIATAQESIASGATKTEASDQNGYIKIDGNETKVYEHPTTEAKAADFMKVGKDANGHAVFSNAVSKEDITALGIASDAEATQSTKGLMSGTDKAKLDGLTFATDDEVDAMLDEVFGAASAT